MPNFEGKMLDFGGATVIFLITMGFLLAGIIGAILSLPVAMAARDIFRQYFRNAVKDSEDPGVRGRGARGATSFGHGTSVGAGRRVMLHHHGAGGSSKGI